MTSTSNKKHNNIDRTVLDEQYINISHKWSLWEGSLSDALKELCQVLTSAIEVARVTIWVLNDSHSGLQRLCSINRSEDVKSEHPVMIFDLMPRYFDSLRQNRLIDASSVLNDDRLKEFPHDYFKSNDIGSLIHAGLNKAGQLSGIISCEHVGNKRIWSEYEKRFLISIADLISQRLVYEDTRRNEAYYRDLSALYKASLDGAIYSIISTDTNGVIQNFNNSACKMLGYTKEEVIGKTTPVIFHDKDEVAQRAKELSQELNREIEPGLDVFMTRARTGKVEEREWTYIRKDGSRFPVLLSVTPLLDDNDKIRGYQGIAIDITDRVLTKRALQEEERRYRLLFEGSGDAIFLMRGDIFVDCNSATLKMFDCEREQIIDKTPYRYSPELQPDGRNSKEKALEKISAAFAGETQQFEWLHQTYNEIPFNAEVTLNVIKIHGEDHLLASVRDISERKQAEKQLAQSRNQLVKQNESLQLINDLSTRLHGSPSIEKALNETLNSLLSLSDTPYVAIYLLDENNQLNLISSHGFNEETRQAGKVMPLENSLTGLALKDGQLLISQDFENDDRINALIKEKLLKSGIQSGVVIPLIYQGKPLGSLNLVYDAKREFSDIEKDALETIGQTLSLSLSNTQQMRELDYMAYHDSLTGLANRSLFHQEFSKNINKVTGETASLMLLDLDRFKEINDTLGHHIGDKLLQQIGPRIKEKLHYLRTLVCRLGGDEFTILIYSIKNPNEILGIAQDILTALRKPFHIDDMDLEIDASIGISIFDKDGKDSHSLLRSADVAMYAAKHKGGGVQLYDESIDFHTPERLALAADLNTAIRENQLVLHYQPKMNLKSDKVVGFEALVRWQHPTRGLLYPDSFMPFAEVSDAIHGLTESVLRIALSQQKAWREEGYDFSVAVNLSARNLIDDRCVLKLKEMLDEYGTRAGQLELEITETALMQDPEGAVELLNEISSLGVKLSIDDFGTGYSSLAYLRQLPIDALKIDRVFVREMLSNEQDAIIVRSVISLAHNLNLRVIAEGVEDENSMQSLQFMNCDQVQGYHICKPGQWSDIRQWLQQL